MGYDRAVRYGSAHHRERARWARILASGAEVPCYRCREPVRAGMVWHLDHAPDGTYGGPSHARCNIVASNQTKAAKDPQPRPSTSW